MRCLERNKSELHYALYYKKEKILDENGHFTGTYKVLYRSPVKVKCNVSAANGTSSVEQFGTSLQYDKVIVIDDKDCPIDENAVLFIDKDPEFDVEGNPIFDYTVKKIAKSLNSISIAISKVSTS